MRAAALSLAACLGACGPGPGDLELHPPPPGSGLLEVGGGHEGGEPGFVPLEVGQELVLEPGAQGGFHVFINVRVSEGGMAFVGDRPLLYREARRVETGELVSRSKHRTRLVPSPEVGGRFETEKSIPLFLCPTPIGIPVADELLELDVRAVREEDDEPVSGKVRFLPRCPTGDQADFCRRICFG